MPFRQAPGVRLRGVPELGTCLAFTPTPPKLHTLNPAAWLIAELCARPGAATLQDEFLSRSVPPLSLTDATAQLAEGIRQLQDSGIIQWSENEETAA